MTVNEYFECNQILDYLHQVKTNVELQTSKYKSNFESAIVDALLKSITTIQQDINNMNRFTFMSVESEPKLNIKSNLEKLHVCNVTSDTEIVYFSLNNWFGGRDYPIGYPFDFWISSNVFSDDDFCKRNKLCVKRGDIDMSVNWCVSAPKSWVVDNCPKLLTDESYEYQIITHYEGKNTVQTCSKKYSDFVFEPDIHGIVEDRFGWEFLEYTPENFGSHIYEEDED